MALRGLKVIELAGLAPAPFCGMILADHGANVIRIDKPNTHPFADTLARGKRSLILDLRKKTATMILKKLCLNADVLVDPYRPGVMEKYKLGPSDLSEINPRLVYARLTGFGQDGPFSKMAGHDINYIAISGVLSMLGSRQKPHHPINLMADFAGGGLICAFGITLALLEREKSGKGQVIDANMVEGSAYVSSFLWTTRTEKLPIPFWSNPRGCNILDGGTHFYDTYQTKDKKYMAVGALEPQFYAQFMNGLGLDPSEYSQYDDWNQLKEKISQIFLTRTQEEWCRTFDFTDACVTPVVQLEEAHKHPHNAGKNSFIVEGDQVAPAPAPRLSKTPALKGLVNPVPGQHSEEILQENQFTKREIDSFFQEGVVHCNSFKSSL